MGTEEWQTYCPTCQRNVLGRRETPNHILHFLITVLTCGLWIFVWGLIVLNAGGQPYRCAICGTPGVNQSAAAPRTPRPIKHVSPSKFAAAKRRSNVSFTIAGLAFTVVVAFVIWTDALLAGRLGGIPAENFILSRQLQIATGCTGAVVVIAIVYLIFNASKVAAMTVVDDTKDAPK